MTAKMNYFGLVGGALTIILVVISLFAPWWKLTAGPYYPFSSSDYLITTALSPFTTDLTIIGTAITFPIIWASNLAIIFSLVAAGIIMIIYSAFPTKPYAKQLLDFSYNKPLFSVIAFIILLFAMTLIFQLLLNLNIPLNGTTTSSLPRGMTQGINVSINVSAAFQWPVWLGATASGLCIAAKLYHRKIAKPNSILLTQKNSP
jgi:hypothetical protein